VTDPIAKPPQSPASTSPAPTKEAPPAVDEELERERLEPGLDTGGKGDVGAAPGRRKGHDNSNT
jgi:hypothetical protein